MQNGIKMRSESLNFYYGEIHALKNITLGFAEKKVTALIGPSGCGKSTYLRCFNRMNDLISGAVMNGFIYLGNDEIHSSGLNVAELRRRVGMVFQKPNPFPKSIYENIAYAPKIHGLVTKTSDTDDLVESSLTRAGLWGEVKDRLKAQATALSGGQQQRLCVARALAMEPEVILMDEPTSALDPIGTQKIEELVCELKEHLTVIIVTHNMQQAARISDYTAFFYTGELIETGDTKNIFTNPSVKMTEDYITGRFG